MQALLYFLLWGAFFFVMMRFGCGAHVMGHGHGHAGKKTQPLSLPGGDRASQPSKATDPVCGMVIDTAGARTALYGGEVYYFCSQSCREKFESSSQSYLTRDGKPAQKMEIDHEHQH